jgi:predicted DNA-binding protein
MNILRRIYERLVDVVTGTKFMEVDLSDEERQLLEERARRIGLTPSMYMQAILIKHLMDHEDEVAEALAEERMRNSDVFPREHK